MLQGMQTGIFIARLYLIFVTILSICDYQNASAQTNIHMKHALSKLETAFTFLFLDI